MARRLAVAGIAVWAAVSLAVTGCERIGGGTPEGPSTEARTAFPAPDGVTAVEVALEADGTSVSRIDDRFAVDRIIERLREGAKRSDIEDPEPLGQLYRVELKGTDPAMQPYTYTFTLNDMTETDALRDAAKLYVEREDGATEAWTVPSGWVRELLGQASYGKPLLRIATAPHSASVTVLANRRIRTASAPAAVAETLQVAGLASDEASPKYKIHWSDPQRFVVRFDPLPEGVSVRFRLDGLMTAEGDSFANVAEPAPYAAWLTSVSASGGLTWADAAGRVERSLELGEAVMIGPSAGEDADAILAYGADGTNTLVDLRDGTFRTLPAISWPESGTPFGNDYGVDVMFGDRVSGDVVYAVRGNRTLYRVRIDTGEASKLYESETPVKSIATAPDGRRVALLVNRPESLTAEGDVLVLNEAGERLTMARGATYGAHSDGFLFPIPMRWVDDRTIAVRRYGGENGVAYVDAGDGSLRVEAGPRLTEAAARLLDEAVGRRAEPFRVLPEPGGGERFAVQTPEGAWLVDPAAARASWLGPGEALQWTDDGLVAVWTQPSSSERYAYVLGFPELD